MAFAIRGIISLLFVLVIWLQAGWATGLFALLVTVRFEMDAFMVDHLNSKIDRLQKTVPNPIRSWENN